MDEIVTVGAEFGKIGTVPKWFLYGGQTHKIDKILYKWKKREGNEPVFYFSVLCGDEQFTLSFATRALEWSLEDEHFQY